MNARNRLRGLLESEGAERPFLILAELLPEGGFNPANIERFLEESAAGRSGLPAGFLFAGVTLPQNPRGLAAMEPADVFSVIDKKGLWSGLDVVPHLTAKDAGVEAIKAALLGFEKMGLESVLALTGDKPASGSGVFDVDSIGLLELVQEANLDAFRRAGRAPFDDVHQFFPLAAVSPFKYTEASLLQQLFKMKKKLRAGARGFITQMGWDSRKSEDFFRWLGEAGLRVPVFGNVFLLQGRTPAARLMAEGKMPGSFVSAELFREITREAPAAALERAAVQTAMYRDLGASGVDLGGLTGFGQLVAIAVRAAEIGANWRDLRSKVDYPPRSLAGGGRPFYLYDTEGRRTPASRPRQPGRKRFFDFLHRNFLARGRRLCPLLAAAARRSRSLRESKGALYRMFLAGEKWAKTLLFDCRECGDCFLPENMGYCTMGECGKGLPNAPCGDADPSGRCGNDPSLRCVGELIYEAAAAEGGAGLRALEERSLPPRDARLEGSASVLNYLLGRDHTGGAGFIQIGESLHATIPRVRAAMQELLDRGPEAFERPSGALAYVTGLISLQARRGADYIDVNVDEFGRDDLDLRVRMMRDYVRLVRACGRGVPVCVDSGSPEVLEAGLEAWYEGRSEPPPPPILNSIKVNTMDRLLPLRGRRPFRFIGLLVDDRSAGREGVYGVDELLDLARSIFEAAVGRHGFRPGDIFFDSTVFPLAIDVPMGENTSGYTYRTFETIRRIRRDPAFKGVHLSLGITNAVRDLPGRQVGVCRAYLARAIEFGLDAAIVNVFHSYGRKPAAPELLEFVDAFIRQDGSPAASKRAIDAMMAFCRENRRPARS